MPLVQYLVANFIRDDFRAEILPELRRLSHKKIIRVIDILIIRSRANGDVVRQEFDEALRNESELVSQPHNEDIEWFTQTDVDTIGSMLPRNTAAILIVFEHVWMDDLDAALSRANQKLDMETPSGALSGAIERYLIQREYLERPARSNGLHHFD